MDEPLHIPEHLARGHAAPQPGETAAESAFRIGERFAETLEQAGLRKGARVLDIGCGPGRMAIALGNRFEGDLDYLGFDINRPDIEFCTEAVSSKYRRFQFRHLDVRNHYYNPEGSIDSLQAKFPTESGSRDFAFASSVFTHMFTDETLHYLREIYRSLAPGGIMHATFFLLTPEARAYIDAKQSRFKFAHQHDKHAVVNNPAAPGKVVGFERDFIVKALKRLGFTDIVHHPGGWSGVQRRHSQDCIIAKRPARKANFLGIPRFR